MGSFNSIKKLIIPEEDWRPVSNSISAICIALILSLTVNVVSGFEYDITPYLVAIIFLLLSIGFTAYYAFKTAIALNDALIERIRLSINEASPTDIKNQESECFKPIRKKMRVIAIIAWMFALSGMASFILAKIELNKLKTSKYIEQTFKHEGHYNKLIKEITVLNKQITQINDLIKSEAKITTTSIVTIKNRISDTDESITHLTKCIDTLASKLLKSDSLIMNDVLYKKYNLMKR